MDELTEVVFNRYLMDLGVNVLVVVVLIVSIYVSRRAFLPAITERTAETRGLDSQEDRAESCRRESDGRLVRLRKCA